MVESQEVNENIYYWKILLLFLSYRYQKIQVIWKFTEQNMEE